jgi:hypothetical protein
MYYITNKNNGWRSEERYPTVAEARDAMHDLINQIAASVLGGEMEKPDFRIMEEPINEEVFSTHCANILKQDGKSIRRNHRR